MYILEANNIPRIFSIPRTGSTLVYNILSYIIKNKSTDLEIPEYTHNYFVTNQPVILMYRDYRNIHVSLKKFENNSNDDRIFSYVQRRVNDFKKMDETYAEAYKLRYEDWENDMGKVLDLAQEILNISLSIDEINYICDLFSKDQMKCRIKSLPEYTKLSSKRAVIKTEEFEYTKFSGNHISDIKTNWETDLDPVWIDKYQKTYEEDFIKYKYKMI